VQWCISSFCVRSGPSRGFQGRLRPSRSAFLPFAPALANLPAMRKTTLPTTPTRDAVRTPLFWLFYEHHDALVASWHGHRVKWPVVCAWAAEQRVSAEVEIARKTWARVCALKAQEKTEREARRRPPLVPTPRQTFPPPVAAPTRAEVPETSRSDAEKRMALMQARINQRSGRLA